MRHAILCGLVAVHCGGNRLFGDASIGSFRIAALQVVCSLALWWVVGFDGKRYWGIQPTTAPTGAAGMPITRTTVIPSMLEKSL
jgi:hypothetical protein